MKKMPICALAIASALIFNPIRLQADADDSAAVSINAPSDFYGPLAPYGIWVQVDNYGRCFRPKDAGVGWRPYCNGHWEWTDDGWYWDSDQPWAWACYHYGQWAYDSNYGWVWTPGTQWAPAWVCWRVGDGYIGWAPMPPRGLVSGRRPDDDAFVFVHADHFDEPVDTSDVIVNKHRVIEHTRYISNIEPVTKDIADVGTTQICKNEGPGLATVEKACGKTFRPVPVSEVYGRGSSDTRFDSTSQQPDMDRHRDTDRQDMQRHENTDRRDISRQHENRDRHESQQDKSWPPANAQPETGPFNSGQSGTVNYENSGQRHGMTQPGNGQDYQRSQTAQPRMNGSQHSAAPSAMPNYNPQAAPGGHQVSPNEGSTQRRLEPLRSGQSHSTTRANPAGHAPQRAVGHGEAQHGQGNSAPANNNQGPGQNNSGQNQNRNQGP